MVETVETRWSSSAERPVPNDVEHLVAEGRDPAAVRQVLRNPFWQCSPDKIACADIFTAAYRQDDFPVTVARPSHTCDPTRLPLLFGWTDVHRMRTGPPGGKSHSVIVDNSKIKRFVPDFGARSPYSAGARQIMAWHNDHPGASPGRQPRGLDNVLCPRGTSGRHDLEPQRLACSSCGSITIQFPLLRI
ncbi:hypothetical protein [Arthrobacter wenxiniae]|uniref:Uncharacterized protein n=1 Tax=Arthrobacter wenxiniae TaxID=2713570 RepID=A0A7Y7M1E3_9MICC|nr:hypothetical protein [Arthrobacter wenxiniae]NVM96984.1 hypothetical protein [Arthrobacter wenxiniae]